MRKAEIIKNLIEYNEWRRGGEGDQPCPTALGITIDSAIKLIGHQQELVDSGIQTIDALKKRLQGLCAKYGIDGRTTGFDTFCDEYDKKRAAAKCKTCCDTGRVYSNEPDGYYYDCPDCINAADKEAY